MTKLCAAVAAATAAVGVTGCGGGGQTVTIDQVNLQTAIAVSIARARHELSIVQCPKGETAKKGVTFTCTATLASGRQIPFTVTGLDDKGNVHYGGFSIPVLAPGAAPAAPAQAGTKQKK